MALVDLLTDLSNFKYTNYSEAGSVQSQVSGRHGTPDDPIDNTDFDNGVGFGVDPNSSPQSFTVRGYTITGDKRFIVKYNGNIIENQGSIYNNLQEFDNIAGIGGGVAYYGNILPITPRGSIYRNDDIGNYQVPQEFQNTNPPGGVSGIQGFQGIQTTLNIPQIELTGPFEDSYQSTLNTEPFIPNAHGSGFMVTPIGDSSLPTSTLTHNVNMITLTGPTTQNYQSALNTNPISVDAHGSDFFTTPLVNYTSQFSIDDLKTNINSGFDRDSMYISGVDEPNTPIFKQFTRGDVGLKRITLTSPNFNPFVFGDGLPYVIPQHNSTGPTQFTIGQFSDEPLIPNLHGSSFTNTPNYTSQIQTDTSLHQMLGGLSTGPVSTQDQTISNVLQTTPIAANAHGSDFITSPIAAFSSRFANQDGMLMQSVFNSGFDRDEMYTDATEPEIPIFKEFNASDKSIKRIKLNSPNFDSNDNRKYFDDGKFKDRLPYNIPARDDSTFGFDEPFILRPIGNTWGLDKPEGEGFFAGVGDFLSQIDSAAGDIVRGAPGFTGLISRTLHDAVRLGKFLLTPKGIFFLAKQAGLQLLNPRSETRIYNPLSLASIAPIVHMDRHLNESGTNKLYEAATKHIGIDLSFISDGDADSPLGKYAKAVKQGPFSKAWVDGTTKRTTIAHLVAMVPSAGGQIALPGIPELSFDLTAGTITSLSPNVFPELNNQPSSPDAPYARNVGSPINIVIDKTTAADMLAGRQGDISEKSIPFQKNIGLLKDDFQGISLGHPAILYDAENPDGKSVEPKLYKEEGDSIPAVRKFIINANDPFNPHVDLALYGEGPVPYKTILTNLSPYIDTDSTIYNKANNYLSLKKKGADGNDGYFRLGTESPSVIKNFNFTSKQSGTDTTGVLGETITYKYDPFKTENDGFISPTIKYFYDNNQGLNQGDDTKDGYVKRYHDALTEGSPKTLGDTYENFVLENGRFGRLGQELDNPNVIINSTFRDETRFPNVLDGEPRQLDGFPISIEDQAVEGRQGQALNYFNVGTTFNGRSVGNLFGPRNRSKFGLTGDGIVTQDVDDDNKYSATKGDGISPLTVYSKNRYTPEDGTTQHEFKITTPFEVGEVDGEVFKRTIDAKSIVDSSLHQRGVEGAPESKAIGVGVSNIDRYRVLAYGELPDKDNTSQRYSERVKAVKDGVKTTESVPPLMTDSGVISVSTKFGSLVKNKSLGDLERMERINRHKYGEEDNNEDYIKFKFFDLNNNKYIIFPATLNGISDSVSAEYSSEKYIGRPDKIHTYIGTDREVSFSFSVAASSKQDLIICWEKLNYLLGLTYPSWRKISNSNRMDAPFITLTIGDMYNKMPGYLQSLSFSVNEQSTWEIDEGYQLPKVMDVECTFIHIGSHILASQGKHYDLPWLKEFRYTEGNEYELSDDRPGVSETDTADFQNLLG